MENYPMVTVTFRDMPSFRCLLSEWEEMGGYIGYLKLYTIAPRRIVKVRKQVLPAIDYPQQAWEG